MGRTCHIPPILYCPLLPSSTGKGGSGDEAAAVGKKTREIGERSWPWLSSSMVVGLDGGDDDDEWQAKEKPCSRGEGVPSEAEEKPRGRGEGTPVEAE
uniref:Uncharacterized protein n=2 Tax=Oryza sativa subsp. japonica TaxID=39947 RepID=Q10HU1_ORYSJ|nr:hypothetical protein OSJNBa0008D12.9 [Oryza sativa Japonica Group]ABF97249.1 hypothetical protein LOC_Os03g37940 [Oryza sativa Japonica Group]